MNIFSLSHLHTPSMETFWFIFKPWSYPIICREMIDDIYIIKKKTTLPSMRLCIVKEYIMFFFHWLTHEEVDSVLNDFHSGACGGHLSRLATTQKKLWAGYFWPSIFKYCVEAVKKCHPNQVFARKIRSNTAPLHPIIILGPFTKWGVYLWTVTQLRLGGINILSWSWITSVNGKRLCLPLHLMLRQQNSLYSTKL